MISAHCGCVQSMNKAIEAQRANTNMQHVKNFSFDLGQAQEYCRNVKLGLKFMLSLIKIGKHLIDKIVDGFFLKDLLKASLIKKLVWIIVKIRHEVVKFSNFSCMFLKLFFEFCLASNGSNQKNEGTLLSIHINQVVFYTIEALIYLFDPFQNLRAEIKK